MAEDCQCLKECVCDKTCPVCGGVKKEPSVLNPTFWDIWLQKLLRNIASMKFQWLLLLYIPTIIGMFRLVPGVTPPTPYISATVGLGFLGGGFITLATSRIIAKTKLKENGNTPAELDTDK
jgi:hypothetical protein